MSRRNGGELSCSCAKLFGHITARGKNCDERCLRRMNGQVAHKVGNWANSPPNLGGESTSLLVKPCDLGARCFKNSQLACAVKEIVVFLTMSASRREFLTGLAGAGVGALFQTQVRRIDVHQHYSSPAYFDLLTRKNAI